MTKIRHHTHRADDNHYQIIKECQDAGLLVEDIHDGGLADIIVVRGTRVEIFEIKAPGKRKNLTLAQITKRMLWGKVIHIVESSEEIFRIMWG